ncbi:MAG: hypothetical protein KAU50_06385 [Candidatus Marinimicrobia bacterium]|nr:hypothetical protein [Candidatus Neomarinimicrobiota bacterium]
MYGQNSLLHQIPLNVAAGEPLTLEAVAEVEQGSVVTVAVFHRITGETVYSEVEFSSAGGGIYFGTIPAGDIVEAGLEYYLAATLDDGSIIAYPDVEPQLNPVSIPVLAQQETFDPLADFQGLAEEEESAILVLSPAPRQIYLPDEVVVAVSLFNVEDVDESTIRLLVDGQDVTAMAEVSTDLVTYMPPKLGNGSHQAEIKVSNLAGVPQEPQAWRFLISQKASVTSERAFRRSGKIVSSTSHKDIDGSVLDVSNLKANFRGGWDWLDLKANMKLTTQEDPFKPPRNRYYAGLETSLFTLGIGDVTPRINRFALDGKRLRGYSANLKLKLINLHVAKGEMERVSQGRNNSAYTISDYSFGYHDDSTGFDHQDTLRISRSKYSFSRDVLAVRPSFGSGRNFELAFTYMKAKDNINSVERELSAGEITITDSAFIENYFSNEEADEDGNRVVTFERLKEIADGNFGYDLPDKDWAGKSPQDNLVLGTDMTIAVNKRRFVVQTGFALSMLNRNIWDPVLSLKELDTFAPGDDSADGLIAGEMDTADVPFDPADFEEHFHINLNQVPLLPIDIFGVQDDPLRAVARMPSLAYYTSAKINYLHNYITLEMSQVGPEFNSLANPNIQKNVKIKSFSDRVRLFRNKLLLTYKYRTTSDDIVKLEDEPITTSTTSALNANINLGRGLPSFNIGTRAYTRNNGITVFDTVLVTDSPDHYIDRREETVTSALTLGFLYTLDLVGSRHDINLNLATNDLTDNIKDRYPEDTLFTTPASQKASSRVTALSVNSRLSKVLRTRVSISSNTSEIGEGEDEWAITSVDTDEGVTLDTNLVAPGMVSMDLLGLEIGGSLRLPQFNNARIKAGVGYSSSKSEGSSIAPPNFSRLGIKGGLEYNITEDLRLVTSFEIRTKTFESKDGGTESVSSSLLGANLQYAF